MRSILLLRVRERAGAVAALAAILAAALVLGVGGSNSPTEAHPGHPQKKLFGHRWYQQPAGGNYAAWMTLSTSDIWLYCDASPAACSNKWLAPFDGAMADWNSQPTTVRMPYGRVSFNPDFDVNVIADHYVFYPNDGVLGIALMYADDARQLYCDLPCTIRQGDAWLGDDQHSGPFSPAANRKATITHEIGHLLSLAHESVNAGETQRYECGFDDTGPIPHSVMAYDCINPPGYPNYGAGEYYVHDWDTCGVNHAYYDPTIQFEKCGCPQSVTSGPSPPASSPGLYHPTTPARILDTRSIYGGKIGQGCVLGVQVAGYGGVPFGASSVVLNATVTEPTTTGYVTLYPSDSPLPVASNLNFTVGQTIPNLVTVKLGADGRVNIYNNSGQTHVILDVAGWYDATGGSTPTPASDGYYHTASPVRIWDTRGSPSPNPTGKLGAGQTQTVDVTTGGVPAGATAVVVNVTATDPTNYGYLTVFPSGESRPLASNLNFGPGETTPNLVIVKVGSDGKVSVFNSQGSTHVIFDVEGWFGAPGTDGLLFRSLPPARILDTRVGLGWPGKLGHNGTATVAVTNVGGLPPSAAAVVLNTTVTESTAGGYLTVFPEGAPPMASNLNFDVGETVANLVAVKVGTDGKVRIYNRQGQVHVIFDVAGYFE